MDPLLLIKKKEGRRVSAGKRRKRNPTCNVFFKSARGSVTAEIRPIAQRWTLGWTPLHRFLMHFLWIRCFYVPLLFFCEIWRLRTDFSRLREVKKKNSDMRYLALLRPEPVKSQPTTSEFNWRTQMFADVHGLLKCPCFFIFPESYSSAAGSLSACAGGVGTKLKKKKASTTVRIFNSTVSSVPARRFSWLQKIPMISFQFLIAAIILGHLKELCRAYFRSSLQLHPISDQKSSLNWPI